MLKKVGIKVLVIIAVFSFVFSINGNVQAASLKDIPNSSADEINFLIERGVINGYNDRTFRPGQSVTRAEAAIMLGIALGLDGTKRATSFIDVASGSAASGYIQSAVDKKIISGYSNSTYRPQNPITRGEMAYLLQRGFNLSEKSNVYFSDIAQSGPQYEAINTIATAGLTVGYSDGTFQPAENVTRQEFAIFVARGLNESFRVQAAPPPTPAPSGTSTGTVTADFLNVRSGPGTSFSVIGKISEGTVVTVLSMDGIWAKINYNSQQGYVSNKYLNLNNSPGGLLQGEIIVVDPGHGGSDPGASNGAVKEKNITLEVSNRLAAKLRSAGATVVMTRTNDTYPDLQDRVDISKEAKGDIFVSIHVNSFTKPDANGSETYYDTSKNASGSESKELAQEIQKQILALVGTNNRGAGVKDTGFYVIKNQNIPSVLVELAFISNSEDLKKLTSPEYQELFAEAIFRGINNYYSN